MRVAGRFRCIVMGPNRRPQALLRDVVAILSLLAMACSCLLFAAHFEIVHGSGPARDECPICLWAKSLGTVGLLSGWVALVLLTAWIVSASLFTSLFPSLHLAFSARSPPRAV